VTLRSRNRNTALLSAAVIASMLGLTAASVPLYQLFCRVTGYGGTTQRAAVLPDIGPEGLQGPPITVSFNADVAPDLPWGFRPVQHSVVVRPGEERLAFYEAVNRGSEPVVGTATFNVTPFSVGLFFNKLQCFCFTEQVLEPGQRIEMPVSFFVDPAMLDDPDGASVREITLSYTFFVDQDATAKLRQRRAGHTS
jgi:cytochrome c oxidase assembly protein subunit 11